MMGTSCTHTQYLKRCVSYGTLCIQLGARGEDTEGSDTKCTVRRLIKD